jgi:hypothetical protein
MFLSIYCNKVTQHAVYQNHMHEQGRIGPPNFGGVLFQGTQKKKKKIAAKTKLLTQKKR